MADNDKEIADAHTRIILARYADTQNIRLGETSTETIVRSYLSKIAHPEEFRRKTILELGAGCSLYVPVFMRHGCTRYYANDLIPERLTASKVVDPRYIAVPGDFRDVTIPEQVDIVFANLTMMFIIPMLNQFVQKIARSLKPGGVFLGMDPNYLCPLSVYRLLVQRKNNPARAFSPLRYAETFRQNGFHVDRLVPFTAPMPRLTSNWLLGTTFWIKATKR